MNQKKVWLYLEKSYGDARIAYHPSDRGRWQYSKVSCRDESIEYNHRDVLPDELVIDLDGSSFEENVEKMKIIAHQLSMDGKKFTIWRTNQEGSGLHIHSFWKGLDKVSEPRLLKELLAEHYTNNMKGIDRQLFGNHLVRMEFGLYEKKVGLGLSKVPLKNGLNVEEHFHKNEIPIEVFEEYGKRVLYYALKRLTPREGVSGVSHQPKCIKYILGDDFVKLKDGGKRALFILASYYRKIPDGELMDLLRNFNRYNLKFPYSNLQLLSTIKSVRTHRGRPVGCNYRHSLLREIGACHIAESCELARGAKTAESAPNVSKKDSTEERGN